MADALPEIIVLSSDEESPPKVGLPANGKVISKSQNIKREQSSIHHSITTSIHSGSSKSLVSTSVVSFQKREEKDHAKNKSQRLLVMKHVPTSKNHGGTESNNIVKKYALATNSKKSCENSLNFNTNSSTLIPNSSKGISPHVRQLTSNKALSVKNLPVTARKSINSPFSKHNKNVNKWVIPSPQSEPSTNIAGILGPKIDSKRSSDSSPNNTLLIGSSINDISVTPVSTNQKFCNANVNNSVSIMRLTNKDSSLGNKAKKSLPNSKCLLNKSLQDTLSKSGVSITNVSKDTVNNNVPSNVNTSKSNCSKTVPFNSISDLQTSLLNVKTLNTNNRMESQNSSNTSKNYVGSTQINKSLLTTTPQLSREISITKIENRGLNSIPLNKSATSSSKGSDTIKTQTSQIGQLQAMHISSLVTQKKRKLENTKEQNLQSKVKTKDALNAIPIVQSDKSKLPPDSSSKNSFTENKRRISLLQKELKKCSSNETADGKTKPPKLDSVKCLKKANSDELCKVNAQNKLGKIVSLDLSLKDITVQGTTAPQETLNLEMSSNSNVKENNCLLNTKKDQTAKQEPHTKQVTSPKLSLKRRLNTISKNDQPAKRNKMEENEGLNKPFSSIPVDKTTEKSRTDDRVPWNSSDDSSAKLKKLLDFSVPIMQKLKFYETGDENGISKSLFKSLNSAKPSYVSSNEYNDLLLDTYKNIKTNPKEMFLHLRQLKTTLSIYKGKQVKVKHRKSSAACGTPEIPTSQSQKSPIPSVRDPKVQSTPLKPNLELITSENVEFASIKSTTAINTPEKHDIQPVSPISIASEPSKMGKPTAIEKSIVHETPKNADQPVCSTPTAFVSSKNTESTGMKLPVMHSASEKSESVSLTSNAYDPLERVKTIVVKSVAHNAFEHTEDQLMYPKSIVDSSAEGVKPIVVELPVVSKTPENPRIHSLSPIIDKPLEPLPMQSSIVPSRSENSEAQLMSLAQNASNNVEFLVVKSPLAHDISEKVEPSVVKSPIMNNPSKNLEVKSSSPTFVLHNTQKNEKTLISSIAHNALEHAESLSVKSSLINTQDESTIQTESLSLISPDTSKVLHVQFADSTTTLNIESVKSVSPPSVLQAESERTCESHVDNYVNKPVPPKTKSLSCNSPCEELEISRTPVISHNHPSLGESSHSRSHLETFDAKLDKRIKYLEDFLRKLDKKIKKLEARELSIDDLDGEDNAYMLEDRYKRKFVKVWEKLCSIKKCSSRFGRETEKRFVYEGTRYDLINKAISRFINKRKPNDRFPNYTEILDIVKKVNDVHQLGMPLKMAENLAIEVFTDVGKELKKRRVRDYKKDFGCSLTDNVNFDDDPAKHDADLNKTLINSVSIGEKKISEIIDKYACQNVEEENMDDESLDGDDCENSLEDAKEADKELPDTDPAGSDSDSGMVPIHENVTKELPDTDPASSDSCSNDETKGSTSKRKDNLIEDMGAVSDASTEPDTSRVIHKERTIEPVVFNPVIFTGDIKIEKI